MGASTSVEETNVFNSNTKEWARIAIIGYIRKYSSMSLNIPPLIVHLCLEYYFRPNLDRWDIKCKSRKLTLKGNTLSVTGNCHKKGTSSFLQQRVKCGKFEWKFKIGQLNAGSGIGVWKINDLYQAKSTINKNCFCQRKYDNNVFGRSINEIFSYKINAINEGDIITMILDLDELKLRYQFHSDRHHVYKTSYDVVDGEYRAIVNLFTMNDSVTLM